MIHKCIALFNLLPTSQPHHWLIAADWLEEKGLDVTASAFRENLPFLVNSKSGYGRLLNNCDGGYGHGEGSSNNYVNNMGFGGYGRGSGDSTGNGHGYGYGEYDGRGEGDGKGGENE